MKKKEDLTFAEETRREKVNLAFTSPLLATCFICFLYVIFRQIDISIIQKFSDVPGYFYIKTISSLVLTGLTFLIPFWIYNIAIGEKVRTLFKKERTKVHSAYYILGSLAVCGFGAAIQQLGNDLVGLAEARGITFIDNLPMFEENPVFFIILSAIIPSICYEIAFRGVFIENLKKHSYAAAIIMSAVAYSLSHYSLKIMPYTLVTGLILGWLYVKSESIYITLTAQILTNGFIAWLYVARNILSPEDAGRLSYYVVLIGLTVGIVCVALLIALFGFTKKHDEKEKEEVYSPKETLWGIFTSFAFYMMIGISVFFLMFYYVQPKEKEEEEDPAPEEACIIIDDRF